MSSDVIALPIDYYDRSMRDRFDAYWPIKKLTNDNWDDGVQLLI